VWESSLNQPPPKREVHHARIGRIAKNVSHRHCGLRNLAVLREPGMGGRRRRGFRIAVSKPVHFVLRLGYPVVPAISGVPYIKQPAEPGQQPCDPDRGGACRLAEPESRHRADGRYRLLPIRSPESVPCFLLPADRGQRDEPTRQFADFRDLGPATAFRVGQPRLARLCPQLGSYAAAEPNTLDLFLENLGSKGPTAVAVALPLAVMAKGASTENSVVATLNISPVCIPVLGCPATVTVNLGAGKNTYSAQSLGIDVDYFFGPSAHWATPHSIYEVQVPLLVNPQTDPFYFLTSESLPQCPNGINQISGICNAFSQTNPPNGSRLSSKILPNTVVGIAPSAAPQCPGPQPGATCPTPYPTSPPPVPQPVSPTFGFCASFSNNLNNPNAAFFLAIGPDGTTYVSSPVNLSSVSPDAFPPGGPYPACPSS
jgi:hypothetical protein